MSVFASVRPSVRGASVSLLPLLTAMTLLCAGARLSAQAPSAPPAVTGVPPLVTFDLADQFGRRWQSDSLAGRWVVLVLGERTHAARMTQWSDSLYRAFGVDSLTVRALMVADLRAVPRIMHRFASQRAPREAHRRMLLDRDGGLSRQLGLDPRILNVVVIAPDRRVRLRLADTPADFEHLDTVRQLVRSR